ncbi:MAG: hypothetical protein OXC92_00520 [Flavobacteriaceae bacterium]|nr:hypothetical protein [Flavobacteriaceae bacterium]
MKTMTIGMGLLMMGLWLGACQSIGEKCDGVKVFDKLSRKEFMNRYNDEPWIDPSKLKNYLVEKHGSFENFVDTAIRNQYKVKGCFENFARSEFVLFLDSNIEIVDGIGGAYYKAFDGLVEMIDKAMIDVIDIIEQGDVIYDSWSALKLDNIIVSKEPWSPYIDICPTFSYDHGIDGGDQYQPFRSTYALSYDDERNLSYGKLDNSLDYWGYVINTDPTN